MKNKFVRYILCMFCFFSLLCFWGCDEEITYHSILVTSSNEQNGTVTGSGIYKTGESVTITATPKGENTFIAWAKNDIVVSKDLEYTFTAQGDESMKYTALFSTDSLDYFIFKSANYDIVGLELSNTSLVATKMLSNTLSASEYSTLYSPIATAENKEIANTGTYSCSEFDTIEKIFYITRSYYFTFEIKMQYSNIENSVLTSDTYSTNFSINFANIKNGVKNGNITTYSTSDMTMTLTETSTLSTLDIEITNLGLPTNWLSTTTQSLLITFTYPIEIPPEI